MVSKKVDIPKEVWDMARALWENNPAMTDREIVEQLKVIFDDGTPTPKSSGSISKRRDKEKWERINPARPPKNEKRMEAIGNHGKQKADDEGISNASDKENNREIKASLITFQEAKQESKRESTQERINKIYRELESDAIDKKEVIRGVIERNNMLIGITVGIANFVDYLCTLDPETQGEEIQRYIILIESLAGANQKATAAHKIQSEIALRTAGVTDTDFGESEQDRRMKGIEQLAGIAERERLERQKGMAGLQDRLRRFRELEVDELAASVGLTDDNSDYDDDIEDADYSEIDE